MTPMISIIIPSWNNMDDLKPCVDSIARTGALGGLAELIIVNNGDFPLTNYFKHLPNTKVIEAGKNLGWERGLVKGLEVARAPYICFQNDDTVIPVANADFYMKLLYPFHDPRVAAVGPATTVASGRHSIFQPEPPVNITAVSYLIFFTVMIERKALEAAGGIDVSAPGGDDFDLSIRLRKLGRQLVINPSAFLIHHGFRSGNRLRGDHTKANGWNSKEMTEETNRWLIQKHGFKTFIETLWGRVDDEPVSGKSDTEGDAIRAIVEKDAYVVELGCGGQKTVKNAVGVDRIPFGDVIPHVGQQSVADIVTEVDKPLPADMKGQFDVVIARHILEHCVDTVKTIAEWKSLLRGAGKLIIAVPNQNLTSSIPMNPEHVHAFTPESLSELMKAFGLIEAQVIDPQNGVSFIGVYTVPSVVGHTTGSFNVEGNLCLK